MSLYNGRSVEVPAAVDRHPSSWKLLADISG
jgi:hypothetical protein